MLYLKELIEHLQQNVNSIKKRFEKRVVEKIVPLIIGSRKRVIFKKSNIGSDHLREKLSSVNTWDVSEAQPEKLNTLKSVVSFYLDNENSSMAPGKLDVITRKKVKYKNVL